MHAWTTLWRKAKRGLNVRKVVAEAGVESGKLNEGGNEEREKEKEKEWGREAGRVASCEHRENRPKRMAKL